MSEAAVVLLSGGIDSATCLAMACRKFDRVVPVHIMYGQQTGDLEKQQAERQRRHFETNYPEVDVEPMKVIDYRSVVSHFAQGVAASGKDFGHMEEDDGRSSGYVPMRNLHLIATAAAIADVKGASTVYHGAQGGDEADYPDCQPEFLDKAAGAIKRSVPEEQELNLMTPLVAMTKSEVIREANELGVNFGYTYSCYSATDVYDPDPCGDCPACVERAEAFDEAGIEDPFGTEIEA